MFDKKFQVLQSESVGILYKSCCGLFCKNKHTAEQSSLFDEGNFCFHAAIAATIIAFAADSSVSAPHTIDATVLLLSTSHT